VRVLPLKKLYRTLYRHFGPQHWWPGDTPVEVMAGAILTQNTSWKNVERAIAALKKARKLSIAKLVETPQGELACLIRSAGYFNVKARRLKAFFGWFLSEIGRRAFYARRLDTAHLRDAMLKQVSGVGPETADSILLYALNRPVFVIDAYTRRILSRHGLPKAEHLKYENLQAVFESSLPMDVALYNEYHALFVACGKLCGKKSPACRACPLDGVKITFPTGKWRRS